MAEDPPLPRSTVDRAVRLTRRLRRMDDDEDLIDDEDRVALRERRDALLEPHGYEARVREGDTDATLVLYPAEWLTDGVVDLSAVEDTDRAVERPLEGPGGDADWDAVEAHNRRVADRIEREHGAVHGATAHAFADFMSNHYAKRIAAATPAERAEFRTEYFPRNAWPSDAQREHVEETMALLAEAAEAE